MNKDTATRDRATIKLTPEQYEQLAQAIQAAQAAIEAHYDTARAELATAGLFGKELDRKARKLAFKMGGFTLPEGWTIAMVTPTGWGQGRLGYRGQKAQDMQP